MYHVHDILHLLKQKPEGYAVEDLMSLLQEEFGQEARFTTCSNHSLDYWQAVDFVLNRQKAVLTNGRITINSQIESC